MIIGPVFHRKTSSGVRLEYFKTARGNPVDFIWNGIPVKILTAAQSHLEYDLRSLRSSMQTVKAKKGIILCSREKAETDGGILVAPWTYFC